MAPTGHAMVLAMMLQLSLFLKKTTEAPEYLMSGNIEELEGRSEVSQRRLEGETHFRGVFEELVAPA